MREIEERILKDGVVLSGDIIKVDRFLNHQIDVKLIRAFANGVKEAFEGEKVDKVLTIETSGIAVAFAVAEAMGDLPLVFARKNKSATTPLDVYEAEVKSFTRGSVGKVIVTKALLNKGERVLLVDDFLAEGNASLGLAEICNQAEATVVGAATVIEKLFQGGRQRLEEKGIKVFAGASIKAFKDNKPVF